MASRSVTCFRNLHYFFSALWCSSEVSNISILISSLTDPSLGQFKWSVLQTSGGEGQVIPTGLSFHSEAGTDRHTQPWLLHHTENVPQPPADHRVHVKFRPVCEKPHGDSDCCSPQTGPCGTRTAQVPNTWRAQPSGRCHLGLQQNCKLEWLL